MMTSTATILVAVASRWLLPRNHGKRNKDDNIDIMAAKLLGRLEGRLQIRAHKRYLREAQSKSYCLTLVMSSILSLLNPR